MDGSLAWINFTINLLGMIGFVGLLMYSRRTRRAVNDLRGRVDRFADNMAALTTQVHNLADVTTKRFDDLASRDQTQQIVKSEVQDAMFILMGLRPPPQTIIAGTNNLGGPVVGGNVGRMEPPGKSERAHTV